MRKIFNKLYLALLIIVAMISSCKKDWLERKQDASSNVPSTLKDAEELANGIRILGWVQTISPRGLGEIGSDDCIISDNNLNLAEAYERNHYTWKKDCYEGSLITVNWDKPWLGIYYSNMCLDILNKIEISPVDIERKNRVKSIALFYRAYLLFDLSQVFCNQYDPQTASSDMGLPIPLRADINVSTERSSLQNLYNQILADLDEAARLIKTIETERNNFTPGRAAVEAMLARVYISMRNYPEALKHSDISLSLYSKLNDFNLLNSTLSFPFVDRGANVEILSEGVSNAYLPWGFLENVPREVYDSYSADDLRKKVLFKTSSTGITYRGSYYGHPFMFTGLTTSEVYMINSECKVRSGDISGGISILNQLLRTRYDKNSNGGKGFQDYMVSDPNAALDLVLAERRKELFRRGLRWSDLRRLNIEPRYAKTITKTYGGKTYSLPPNDINYTLQIPPFEVNIVPNIRHDILGQ